MRCSRCHLDKPDGEFAPSAVARRAAGGKKGDYCRPCKRDYYRGRERDPVLKSAGKKRALARLLADPTLRVKHKIRTRNKELRRRYGMTVPEYEARLSEQGGRCACCGSEDPGGGSFRVDHDHATGAVRGLLCNRCNSGIGMLGDTPEAIEKALSYLNRGVVPGRLHLAGNELPVTLQ
jgi:hypothetical protein